MALTRWRRSRLESTAIPHAQFGQRGTTLRTEFDFVEAARKQRRLSIDDENALCRRLGKPASESDRLSAHHAERPTSEQREAMREIVAANLWLVCRVVRPFVARRPGLQADLLQEGVLGLYRAVESFDPERGVPFRNYAMWWVLKFVIDSVRMCRHAVRVPPHVEPDLRRLRRSLSGFSSRGRSADAPLWALACALRMSLDRVVRLLPLLRPVRSVDTALTERQEERFTFLPERELQLLDDELDHRDLRKALWTSLGDLDPRWCRVIELRFGLDGEPPRTLEQIGEEFGLTRERVRQLQEQALERLRVPARAARLEPFLAGE
jgi:RNA polymerase sigma factor (sigma-70 family)